MAGRRVGPIAVLALCAVLLGATVAPLVQDMAKRPQDCVAGQCAQPEARLADSLLALRRTLVKKKAVDEEISGLPGGLNFAQTAGPPILIYVGVRQGLMVDSVSFLQTNGHYLNYPFYGDGNGGSAAPGFTLGQGEYISEVRGRAGHNLDMIQFVTQRGRTSSQYGGQGGSAFVLRAPKGWSIDGLNNLKSGGRMRVGMVLANLPDNRWEECWSNQQALCKDDGATVCSWCGWHYGKSYNNYTHAEPMHCCRENWRWDQPTQRECRGAYYGMNGGEQRRRGTFHQCVVLREPVCYDLAGYRCGSKVRAVCPKGSYCSIHDWCGPANTHDSGFTQWSNNYDDACHQIPRRRRARRRDRRRRYNR